MSNRIAYILSGMIFLAGIFIIVMPVIGFDFSTLPGDAGDTRFNMYVLENGYQAYFQNKSFFWDAPFMFPEKNTIALSDNLLGSMPVYALFRAFHLDRETALQAWFISMFLLNFASSFFIYKRISSNVLISALAAFIFTFGIPVMAQVNHIQTLPRFAVPFIFYAAWRFTQLYQPFYFFVILSGIVFQLYCGMYAGMLTFFAIFIFMIIHLFINGSWKKFTGFFDEYRWTISFITIWTIIFVYPIYAHYIKAGETVGMRSYDEIKATLPHVWSWLFPYHHSYVWTMFSELGNSQNSWWEHILFIGSIPIIAILYALIFKWRKSYIHSTRNNLFFASALSIALLIAFTLSINDYSLFAIIRKIVPGFAAMRAVTRVVFPILFLAGLCLFPLFEAIQRRNWGIGTSLVILSFALVEQCGPSAYSIRFSKENIQQRHKILVNLIDTAQYKPKDILVILGEEPYHADQLQLDAMLVSQSLGMKTINGYSSSAPGSFGNFWSKPDSTQLHNWLAQYPDINNNRLRIIYESDSLFLKK